MLETSSLHIDNIYNSFKETLGSQDSFNRSSQLFKLSSFSYLSYNKNEQHAKYKKQLLPFSEEMAAV